MSESERLELERRYAALRVMEEHVTSGLRAAEEELLELRRESAALRTALTAIKHADHIEQAIDLACAALRPDAGRAIETRSVPIPPEVQEQITRGLEIGPAAACTRNKPLTHEQVQPLVDALKGCVGVPLVDIDFGPIMKALAHAKTLGFE